MVYIVQDQYFLVKAAHQKYLEDRERITMDMIREMIVELPANSIVHIVSKFREREREFKDGNFMSKMPRLKKIDEIEE